MQPCKSELLPHPVTLQQHSFLVLLIIVVVVFVVVVIVINF